MRSQTQADLSRYVNEGHFYGRYGYTGLDWRCRGWLFDGVDIDGGHALEIGAGDGMISLWMLSAGARSVVSLEPEADGSSHDAAATIEKHARALGLDSGRWSVRRETFQSFKPDRPFRAILSQDSVNHLDEDACVRLLDDPSARRTYRDLFARMADMLESGGHVILADCAR